MTDPFALVFDPAAWAALATLVAMELVLGVDNLVFLALVVASWALRPASRKVGAPAAHAGTDQGDRLPIPRLVGQPSF